MNKHQDIFTNFQTMGENYEMKIIMQKAQITSGIAYVQVK